MSATRPAYIERPGLLGTLRELRTPLEGPKFLLRLSHLANAPRGDGRAIALAPGYLAGEFSLLPLAQFLRFLGYTVYPWGLGSNNGDVEEDIGLFGARIQELHNELDGEKITLIGWSLGGVIAREVARQWDSCVAEVITLATPIVGGPKYTALGDFYAFQKGVDLDWIDQEVHERNKLGLNQPVTSVYSKSDGIVAWQASVDVYNPQARNVAINTTHIGIGVSPVAWRLIADILAEEEKITRAVAEA